MFEVSFVIDLIKYLGFPAVLFFMWLMDHKAKEKHVDTLIGLLREQVDHAKDMIETMNYHGAILSRVENLINDNQFCPLIRKENKPR
jgi:formylmethanofuran dehydrogenase subunit B